MRKERQEKRKRGRKEKDEDENNYWQDRIKQCMNERKQKKGKRQRKLRK